MHKNLSTFLGCDWDYTPARTVLFGAPFDGTTSFRPGTRFGPGAMRTESVGLETYSPYQDMELEDCAVFDAGDLEFPFGNTKAVLSAIESMTQCILADGKRPAMLGGEHLVTLGAVRAVCKSHPDLHIIHLDAHADLRDEYLGETLSHATVLRRVWELLGDKRVHQFGIRSMSKDESVFAGEGHVSQQKFDCQGFAATLEELSGAPLYVTIDLDVLDPSAFPGTGTPEAGGIAFSQLLSCILSLKGQNICGFDINELSPHYDLSGASTATACKVLREMLMAADTSLK